MDSKLVKNFLNFRKATEIILFLLPFSVFSQDLAKQKTDFLAYSDSANNYFYTDSSKAFLFNRKALELTRKNKFWKSYLYTLDRKFALTIYYNCYSVADQTLDETQSVLKNYRKEIGDTVFQVYNLRQIKNSGIYRFVLNDFISAKKSFEFFDENYSKISSFKQTDYYYLEENALYLSRTSNALKEYESYFSIELKCLEYIKKSSTNPDSEQKFFSNYNHLSKAYLEIKDTVKAALYMQKAVENVQYFLDRLNAESGIATNAKNIFMRAGELYLNIKDLQKAEIFLKKAHAIDEPTKQFENELLRLDAKLEIGKGNFSSALKKYSEALLVYPKAEIADQSLELANTHFDMAQLFYASDNSEQALTSCQLALINCSRSFSDSALSANPGFNDVLSKQDLLSFLTLKSKILLNARSKKELYLELSKATSNYAISILDSIRSDFASDFDKQFLLQSSFPVFETNITAINLLFKKNAARSLFSDAFQAFEKSKALILLEAMKAGQSDVVLSENDRTDFYQIKTTLTQYDKAVKEEKNPVPENAQWVSNQSKFLSAQMAYASFLAHLSKTYPEYYNLRYQPQLISLEETQNILNNNQTLLQYFVGDSSIFVFTIKPDSYNVVEIKKDFPLDYWVKQLRASLSAENYATQGALYTEVAFKLYEKLVAPVQTYLTEEVIIVPDGVLGYLPFEALLTEKPSIAARFKTHKYLLNAHSISYSFSATLLREMMQKKHRTNPNTPLIAYAPFFQGDMTLINQKFSDDVAMRNGLNPLESSGEEVTRIAKAMNGEKRIGAEATAQNFIETAPSARILHLATHGKADDVSSEFSYLAFAPQRDSTKNCMTNGLIYVRDLYNLSLNADLVTLSACETGIGKLQRGEGIISLARAFTYAGAKSVVTSLWSVNDAKTKDLMLLFYANLHRGMSKNNALREAKRSFIARNVNPHPFFWASFIAIGDMSALRK